MRIHNILICLLLTSCATAPNVGSSATPMWDYPNTPYPAPAGAHWEKRSLPILLSDPNWDGTGDNVAPKDPPTFKWILVEDTP